MRWRGNFFKRHLNLGCCFQQGGEFRIKIVPGYLIIQRLF